MKELLEMLEKCVSSLLTEKVSWSTSRERKVGSQFMYTVIREPKKAAGDGADLCNPKPPK